MNRPDALTQGVVDAWRDLSHEQRNLAIERLPGLVSACVALEAVSRIRLVIVD